MPSPEIITAVADTNLKTLGEAPATAMALVM